MYFRWPANICLQRDQLTPLKSAPTATSQIYIHYFGTARISKSQAWSILTHRFCFISIPDICHEHHERRLCKFFLAGVNFYRFNAKNWHFRQILCEKVAFFTDLTRMAFFGVNFILQKFCQCKKYDKYEVWFIVAQNCYFGGQNCSFGDILCHRKLKRRKIMVQMIGIIVY